MHHLTRLASFALNENHPPEIIEPQTAIGRRLVDLSSAFDSDSLSNLEIEFYLDELATVCERELRGAPRQVADFLNGALDLIEEFECKEHSQLVREVSLLEWKLTRVAVSISFAEAA